MMYKVGICGFGKMGKIRAETVDSHPDLELKSIYDPIHKKTNRDDVNLCESYNQLLESDVDVVFIAGYVEYAAEYTRKALNAGKHVFCEKPPATHSHELIEVQASLDSSKKILKYGFNHRYHYSVIEAKRIIDSGEIGEITILRGVYGKAGSLDFQKNWRNYKKFSGGGILIDQGIHMLDLFMYLANSEFNCSGSIVRTLQWDIECEDNVMALFETGSGIVASLHSSATQWKHKFNLEILGTKGFVTLDGILSATMSYAPEKMIVGLRKDERIGMSMGKPIEKVYIYEKDDSWLMELNEFVNAISGKRSVENGTIADSVRAMKLVEDIYSKGSAIFKQ
jgi:predicted dehydrogenase